MAIRELACQRTEQSGMGLPRSTTSRTEWHARISRQRRGVRQPYVAFGATIAFTFFASRCSFWSTGFPTRCGCIRLFKSFSIRWNYSPMDKSEGLVEFPMNG